MSPLPAEDSGLHHLEPRHGRQKSLGCVVGSFHFNVFNFVVNGCIPHQTAPSPTQMCGNWLHSAPNSTKPNSDVRYMVAFRTKQHQAQLSCAVNGCIPHQTAPSPTQLCGKWLHSAPNSTKPNSDVRKMVAFRTKQHQAQLRCAVNGCIPHQTAPSPTQLCCKWLHSAPNSTKPNSDVL